MTEELKPLPCPFCNGDAEHSWRKELGTGRELHRAECTRCGASIGFYQSKEDTLSHWNTRSPAWRDDMSAAITSQARRLYHHMAHGGVITKEDIGRLIERLEALPLPPEEKA